MKMSRFLAVAAITAVALQLARRRPATRTAISYSVFTDLTGGPALALALRKLTTTGTVVHMTAHPDDENNAVLALYARHVGARVALVTATRGDGGQNEIGTEIFDALGVLRTEELLAAHRFDGAEQVLHTRRRLRLFVQPAGDAREVGAARRFSVTSCVISARCGPDVIISHEPGRRWRRPAPPDGGRCWQPRRFAPQPIRRSFPSRSRDGLRPWQALKIYRPAGGFGGRIGRGVPGARGRRSRGRRGQRGGGPPAAPHRRRLCHARYERFEPFLGCTIGEIGGVASGMHLCQGRVPMVPPPGATGARYRVFDTTLPKPASSARVLALRRNRRLARGPRALCRRAATAARS